MKINQEKEFKPLTITLETKKEYIAFMQIVDEANNVKMQNIVHMTSDAWDLVHELSDYFTNDV